MYLTIYQAEDNTSPLHRFLDLYYSTRMTYFASDLLKEGLAVSDISQAVSRAMAAGQAAGLDLREHFMPVYTHSPFGMVNDCRLSKEGFALVMLNADPSVPAVGRWQVQLIQHYIS